MELGPGALLNEYEIVRPLGAGGMGEVFLARDTRLDRLAALKILRWQTDADAERVMRFATEAKAAAALSHPNLAAIYGIGQCGQICFIAMEYVKGETLRGARLEPDAAIDAMLQAASALAAAHEAGIVHRDIKPANIMRTESGLVKVLDFGLAKRVAAPGSGPREAGLTSAGTVMGTLGYMSPEQLLGLEVDHRTDIFSLGVVMYELLTGKRPFAADSHETALAELAGVSRGPVDAPATASPAVAAAVMRCMERDPERRFPTAAAFAAALCEATVTKPAPMQRPRSSRREWIAAAAVTALGGGVAAFKFRPGPSGPIDSLAVLPFSGGSSGSSIDYLREGIAEGLMNRLSSVGGLRVISRDSAFRHRGQVANEAGRALGVRAVVAGAIHEVGGALLINAELVDSGNDRRVWGEEFRAGTGDILDVRDRIADKIAGHLRAQLGLAGTEAKPRAVARETADSRAHDLYLRGRFLTNRFTAAEVKSGLDFLRQAVEIDPEYALAHAALAEAHLFMADLFEPAHQALPPARESAQRAVELDANLADAHVASAMVKAQSDMDWPGAEASLRRASELNPNLPLAHGFRGWILSATGHQEEGLAANRRAVELEPRSPLAHALLAANLYFARKYGDSFSAAGRALEIDPAFPLALYWRGLSMIGRGVPSLVVAKLESMAVADPPPMFIAALGRARAASGRVEEARQSLAALQRASESQHVSALLVAGLQAALHEKDAALKSLERAYETRARLLLWTRLDPVYAELHGDPRFEALLAKLKV